MDDNTSNTEFYRGLLEQYGPDARAVGWRSVSTQELRFRILAKVALLHNVSLLDVGCGMGDFWGWLKRRGWFPDYVGIDMTPELVGIAKKRYPEANFRQLDLFKVSASASYDYVVASGIFYRREEKPFEYMQSAVTRMFELSRYGVAFNSLSRWGECDDENEFCADPVETLKFCRNLTRHVVLMHHYHPGDFTIFLYRRPLL